MAKIAYTHNAPDHEKDGIMELNVHGLQGVLASPQVSKVHDHKSFAYGHGGQIELIDLEDVDISDIADGYVLYYDLVSETFKFKECSGEGITNLDGGAASTVYGGVGDSPIDCGGA